MKVAMRNQCCKRGPWAKLAPTMIVFGRGGTGNKHTGNVSYRKTVLAYKSHYAFACRKDKGCIVHAIMDQLKSQGRIFVERHSDGLWYEVTSHAAIRRKVVQACREGAPEIRAAAYADDAPSFKPVPVDLFEDSDETEEFENLAVGGVWDDDILQDETYLDEELDRLLSHFE